MSKRKRDLSGVGLAALNRFAGSETVARLKLSRPAGKALYRASKAGFRVASAASRQFKAVRKLLQPARMPRPAGQGLFDLTPTDEQQMIQASVRRFAEARLRPAAAAADAARALDQAIAGEAADLGLALMAVPEALDGAGAERTPVTAALVAEALAWGDMGQAVALLAPVAVANVLADAGSAQQQARYLGAFAEASAPRAALALHEPVPFFDPMQPQLTARIDGDGLVLEGQKSLVPLAADAELLVVSAMLADQGPRLLLVEVGDEGLAVADEPAMGLRAAAPGRLEFRGLRVPRDAVLGDAEDLARAVLLSRLGWCALAVGTAQAVLDYVIPYVNERQAFGEPISHRQGVAFPVADIGIELNAMRLLLWRAASRAEQGLPFVREAALAHRFCADKAMMIGSSGVQLLGGHGFVCEHPVERWYRDLRAVGTMEGGVSL